MSRQSYFDGNTVTLIAGLLVTGCVCFFAGFLVSSWQHDQIDQIEQRVYYHAD